MLSLDDLISKPRKSIASFGEALPWFGMVTDGAVLCHDGSVIAGFHFAGADIEGVSDAEVNQRIDFLSQSLRQFNERITVWFVQSRKYQTEYPYVDYPDPVSSLVDWEWGQSCESVPNARIHQSMYIGFKYPSKTEALFEEVQRAAESEDGGFGKALISVFRKRLSEKTAIGQVRGQLAEMVDEFEQIIANFYALIRDQVGMVRLYGADLLGDLYGMANLASDAGPVEPPRGLSYLNTLLPADDVIRQGDLLCFRGPSRSKHCAVLSTTGLPKTASSFQMDALMAAPCEFVLIHTFQLLDRVAAEKTIVDAEEHYRNEVKSVMVRIFERVSGIESDKVNTGNLVLAEDAQEALADLTANDTLFGYYSMSLLALGNSQKEAVRSVDLLSTRMRSAGYTITRERQGIFSGFLGSLPGNYAVQARKYLISMENLADLAPIRTISTGQSQHQLFSECLGRNVQAHVRFLTPLGVPFDFNLHAEDLGHTVAIGGSGSGKTSLMQLIVAQFQKYYPANTFIFDKDRSMALLSVLMNGSHIDLSPTAERRPKLNPVKRMLMDGNMLALTSWVSVLIAAQGDVLTPEDEEKLSVAVQKLASMGHLHWRLGTLYSMLNGTDIPLARKLAPYVDRSDEHGSLGKGIYAEFFDNDEDDLSLESLVCMETGALLANAKLSAPFMDYAFYCIEQRLDGHTPTLIYVEEAWYMLANEKFEDKINDWLRTFRKKKAFVIFATQSPMELQKLKSWAAFIANVPTFIFLRSIKDSIEQTADIYRSLFNLNDSQLALISDAMPKRDYVLIKPEVTRLVNATMPPTLLAINSGTSKNGVLEKAFEYKAARGDNWQFAFLKEVLHVDIEGN